MAYLREGRKILKLSELGEFALIDRIAKGIKVQESRVKVGIGDDAAVIKTSKSALTVLTSDTLIQGIHFDFKYYTFFELGWKALAVNISDVIAMGAKATEALITLGLPKDIRVEAVDELYTGIKRLAGRYRISIVGGDMVSSPKEVVISITLVGEVKKKNLLLRRGAKVGDSILVTGDLGTSCLGLHVLKKKGRAKSKKLKYAINKHLLPEPRVSEANVIAASGLATSMIDISDGLTMSLSEIGKLSKIGSLIWIDALPIKKRVRDAAKKLGKSALDFALYGGEDYELLVTCKKGDALRLASLVEKKTGTPLTIIGEIVSKKKGIKLITRKGKLVPVKARGYEHFRSR